MVQLIICVHFVVFTANCTLGIYLPWHSFCYILRFCIRISIVQMEVIDHVRLSLLWCINLILEMYSRYFDPIININMQVNKHHTSQELLLMFTLHRDFKGLLLP
jgi:hypothetical protein